MSENIEEFIERQFEAQRREEVIRATFQPAPTQYEMEALESRYGPTVWASMKEETPHEKVRRIAKECGIECVLKEPFPVAAQDAIDDWRLANPRKRTPVTSGVLAYFPDAIMEVAKVSHAGNRQHGTTGWDRSKSGDELDALSRHLLDHIKGEMRDTDGMLHLAKVAWRALAALQRLLDA